MSEQMTRTSAVIAGLNAVVKGLQSDAVEAAGEIATLLEAYAKQNHPWQNQSGDTEASIKGQISQATNEMVVVTLSAGMDYDKFLELAHEGKWAWLHPALLANQEAIRAILRRRMGRGKGIVSVRRAG